MRLVDALVETLAAWETEFVFGVSGANIEHLHDAIHRHKGRKISSIFAKSEVGAAFMADGYARRHNRLGVSCSTSGGGMMNLAVGIAESYAESVPTLALVGQPPMELEGRGAFQDSSGKPRSVNALALWGAMTKFVARLDSPDIFWDTLINAAQTALNDRPGPSVLLIPRNAYTWEVPNAPLELPPSLQSLKQISKPDAADIDQLWRLLSGAKCPVLMLGSGCRRSQNFQDVVDFAILSRIPVVSTMADPSAFPNDEANYFGIIGCAGHPSAHDFLNTQADLIVIVGSGLNIMVRSPIEPALRKSRLILINIDPDPILSIVSPSLVIASDAGEVFQELKVRFGFYPLALKKKADYVLTHYERKPRDLELRQKNHLLPSDVVTILQDYLRTTKHILFDAGNCAATAEHFLKIPRETSTNIALGFGGMGYAIAASIGATIGHNNGSTAVICGDGAFLMLGMEVHTAAHYGLPILFIVFNNAAHGMCKTRQQLFFDGRLECSLYPPFNAAETARSLAHDSAIWTGHAETADEVRKLLFEYHSNYGHLPGVLDIAVTSDEMPPFSPFLSHETKTTTNF